MVRLLYFFVIFTAVLRAQEGTLKLEGRYLVQEQGAEKSCFFSVNHALPSQRMLPVECRPDLSAQYQYEIEFGINGCQLAPQTIVRIIEPQAKPRSYKKLDAYFVSKGVSSDCF